MMRGFPDVHFTCVKVAGGDDQPLRTLAQSAITEDDLEGLPKAGGVVF